MICRVCGKEINPQAVVCPFCGCATDVQSAYAQPVAARRSRVKIRPIVGFSLALSSVLLIILGLTGLMGIIALVTSASEYQKVKKVKNGQPEFAIAGIVLGGVITLFYIFYLASVAINFYWQNTAGILLF